MKFSSSVFLAMAVVCHSLPMSSRTFNTRAIDLQEETERLLFTATMDEFKAARAARDPAELDWESNGCTASPDQPLGYDFQPSCYRHDFGYHNYKIQERFTEENKDRIDSNFKDDMYDECGTHGTIGKALCKGVANVYYEAVSVFGAKRDVQLS